MQKWLRTAEIQRKTLVEEGNKKTKEFQDSYTNLKNAKESFEACNAVYVEAEGFYNKKISSSSKEKELEKVRIKLNAAKEKVQSANESFIACQDACRDWQLQYYKEIMPAILKKLQQLEFEGNRQVQDFLSACTQAESICYRNELDCIKKNHLKFMEVDIMEDIQSFHEAHVMESNESNNFSVRSIVNATKAGRLQMLSKNCFNFS